MKHHSSKGLVILLLSVLSGIVIAFVLWSLARTDREIDRLKSGQLSALPTARETHEAHIAARGGARVFPYAADCHDAIEFGPFVFAAASSALVRGNGASVDVFHRGGGLPATDILALAVFEGALHVLAPEGLLVAARPDGDPLIMRRYAPRDGTRLVAMAADATQLVVLDEKGRLLQFQNDAFFVLAPAKATAGAQMTLYQGRPAVGGPAGDLWMLTGAGDTAQRDTLWPKNVAAQPVLAVEGGEESLWVGTAGDLWRVGSFGAESAQTGAAVTAIVEADDGVWLGGPTGRLWNLDGEKEYDVGASIHGLRRAGDVLLIAADNGVWRRAAGGDPEPALPGEPLRPLPEGYVSAIAPFTGGRLLVGTLNRGLAVFDPKAGKTVATALSRLGINRVVIDGAKVWVASTNGLFVLDSKLGVQRIYNKEAGLPHRYVSSVVRHEGSTYVSTSRGLAEIGTGGVRAIDAFHGLAGNALYCLAVFGRGLVTGGLSGLTQVDTGRGLQARRSWTASAGELPHNWVHAVVPVDKEIFVGTYGGGVAVVGEDGKVRVITDTAGISINPEAAVHHDGVLCFGTVTRGLLVGRGSRWTSFDTGLPSRNVTALAVVEDTLWVGTDHGLAGLPWNQVAAAVR
ncbi:MAG: hypothetical protein P9L99_21475 [Candidatus Lernaella stagnicola]|nr:hypothetical protein [Candidatus Lernaella stagnicola]